MTYRQEEKKYEVLRSQYMIGQTDIASPSLTPRNSKMEDINSHFKGWIMIPGTKVNYPIVQGFDNLFYLSHDFWKNESKNGCLFIDSSNDLKIDDNIIIYGHNMKDGSMFGTLKQYRSKRYLNEHKKIYINWKGETTLFTIFSCQIISSSDHSIYRPSFYSDKEKKSYLDNMAEKSLYAAGTQPTVSDKIITLSTCSGGDSRMIIQAWKCNSGEEEKGSLIK